MIAIYKVIILWQQTQKLYKINIRKKSKR